ncbi:hypothetical protein O0L34_g14689 [Tuta absoluta]|nr:hypothetical protein O0L34_g14689 [Tuta absoluta]
MPVLYKCIFSAPSRGALMTIEALNLQDKFTYFDMDPLAGDNRKPEYMEKNPLHTVPVLEDDDLVLCDSHVIMTYIVQKYAPESSLYPKDLKTRCLIDQKMYLESTSMTPKIITSMDSLKAGLKGITEKQKEALLELYSWLNGFLSKTKYLATDHLTLADLTCCSSLGSLALFLPIPDEFKNLKAWYAMLEKEDWFQKINAKGIEIFREKIKPFYE